jgi:hypothetical protein
MRGDDMSIVPEGAQTAQADTPSQPMYNVALWVSRAMDSPIHCLSTEAVGHRRFIQPGRHVHQLKNEPWKGGRQKGMPRGRA